MTRPFFLLLPAVLLGLCSCGDHAPKPTGHEASNSTRAVIRTGQGEVSLDLEVAASGAEQEKGLSGRKTLPAGTGMLFPLDPPRKPNFWMKDTHFALDLIFIRADGSIAAILPGKPDDRTPISTGEPARGVIEIGHGEAARLGLKPGDRVGWGDCTAGAARDPLKFCPG